MCGTSNTSILRPVSLPPKWHLYWFIHLFFQSFCKKSKETNKFAFIWKTAVRFRCVLLNSSVVVLVCVVGCGLTAFSDIRMETFDVSHQTMMTRTMQRGTATQRSKCDLTVICTAGVSLMS